MTYHELQAVRWAREQLGECTQHDSVASQTCNKCKNLAVLDRLIIKAETPVTPGEEGITDG